MIYKVHITKNFAAELKFLQKKDRTLAERLHEGLRHFEERTKVSLGSNVYKVRVKRPDQGKSRSYRLYIYLVETHNTLVPLTIFAKNKRPDISDKELTGLVRAIKIETNLS